MPVACPTALRRCPALDTLFLAAPVAKKGSLTQYVGRVLRSRENKATAEVHDYLDQRTGALAAMLAKRAPGYSGLGFPDPRKLALTPRQHPSSSRNGVPAAAGLGCALVMLRVPIARLCRRPVVRLRMSRWAPVSRRR